MATKLRHHPFAVEALLTRTTVLTYAAPAAELQRLLPGCLTPDVLDDTWGFVAAALVQTHNLRPKGLPAWLGQSFFLIGYRVFVRYTTPAGRRLRGLYILKSETDKRQMQWLGNLFTSYRYSAIDLAYTATETSLEFISRRADVAIQASLLPEEVGLPATSPFGSWQQARRFAGPLPFTFSYVPATREVIIVEGVREAWQPRPVQVEQAHVGFLTQLPVSELRLASAFTMENIPYSWKKGRSEQWRA